ncbi:MAG: hypothetical protein Fur0025_27420 [Oscillatoriaceae cyanobacterium]
MYLEELLKWTDDRVVANTGQHLDSLQKSILKAILQEHNYQEVAAQHHVTYHHVKKQAWRLWHILSDTLGEEVKKSNVRSVLESQGISNISHLGERVQIVSNINGYINICSENPPSPSPPNSTPQPKSQLIDLTEAPELIDDAEEYRQAELTTLKQWILDSNRLITIYGLSGIGKSQLAVKLIPEIQTEFDCIIWRSLSNAPTFSTLQTELTQFFAPSQPTPLPTVIDYFRSDRCLVILDDLQNIFQTGELAGQYASGYEDYGKFFKQVATTPHQSCLILLSWEKPRDFTTLSSQNRLLQAFHLQGIEPQAANFLQEKGLTDEARWSELITLYQGHPTWLNIIAAAIVELCNGSVAEFLDDTDNIFLGDLEPLLSSHLERLSELEKKVSHWLASETEAVDISQPPNPQRNRVSHPNDPVSNQLGGLETRFLSKSDLWQAIQSLSRRGLVEKVTLGAKVRFRLNPVFQQYIRSKFG